MDRIIWACFKTRESLESLMDCAVYTASIREMDEVSHRLQYWENDSNGLYGSKVFQ